jgi:hypothetical protein
MKKPEPIRMIPVRIIPLSSHQRIHVERPVRGAFVRIRFKESLDSDTWKERAVLTVPLAALEPLCAALAEARMTLESLLRNN